jgi:hypothetical protein
MRKETVVDVETIAGKLTEAQRKGLLALTSEYQSGRSLKSVTLTTRNSLRRLKLAEAEDAQRAIWNYRLTPLGLAVRAALKENGNAS